MKKLLNHYMTEFLGRTTVHDVYDPLTGKLIIEAGEEITEDIARIIEDSPIEAG